MKIDYVVVGSTTNPYYLDFWPIISKVWSQKFNITPILGLISNEDSDFEKSEFGLIKKFKSIDGVDVGLQSQIVRLFLPKFLEGYCLISDIDMIPISVDYFNECSNFLTENNVVIYSSDNPECLKNNEYPMCYVSSHSKTFKSIFDLDMDWDSFVTILNNNKHGWSTNQKILFQKVNEYNTKTNNVVYLKREWSGLASKRIDRSFWSYSVDKLKQGEYIDCHSLRPYDSNKGEIDKLVNLILE